MVTAGSPLSHRAPPTGRGTDLLSLHEVGHVAIVVHTAGVEASAGALAADAGHEADLGLLVRGVHRADGHHAADDLQQPVAAAHLVLPQGHVQQLVPAKRNPTATGVTHPPGNTAPKREGEGQAHGQLSRQGWGEGAPDELGARDRGREVPELVGFPPHKLQGSGGQAASTRDSFPKPQQASVSGNGKSLSGAGSTPHLPANVGGAFSRPPPSPLLNQKSHQ